MSVCKPIVKSMVFIALLIKKYIYNHFKKYLYFYKFWAFNNGGIRHFFLEGKKNIWWEPCFGTASYQYFNKFNNVKHVKSSTKIMQNLEH